MHTVKSVPCVASLLACGGSHFTANAAEEPDLSAAPPYRPLTLSLEAGTTGLGGSLSWRFADHWGARAGFNGLQYSDSGFPIKALTYDAKIRIMSEPLTFDIYPWKASSFRISLGLQFNQNELSGTADATGIVLPPPQIGSLDLDIQQQPVNPYLSIGGNILYFDRAHHWALGGELGVAYTGNPEVSLTRSGAPAPLLDAAVQYEQEQVEDYADKFRLWPVVKLMVTYSF